MNEVINFLKTINIYIKVFERRNRPEEWGEHVIGRMTNIVVHYVGIGVTIKWSLISTVVGALNSLIRLIHPSLQQHLSTSTA